MERIIIVLAVAFLKKLKQRFADKPIVVEIIDTLIGLLENLTGPMAVEALNEFSGFMCDITDSLVAGKSIEAICVSMEEEGDA